MKRRDFLSATGAGAMAAALPQQVFAQAYPSKPIKFVVGFAPGGATDVVGRLMARKIGDALGQPIIIENKAGGSSNIGAEVVFRSAPDGYTFYVCAITSAINASLFPKLPFDFAKDFEPVALFAKVPNILVVHPSVPAKSLKELIDYARANPGKLSYASSGSGTSIHMCGELFKILAKVDMVHIPYKGSAPAMTDMIGGQVQVMFDNMPSALPHVKTGKLRALAVTSAQRSLSAPDVPTMGEAGLNGFDVQSWFGLMAPKGTPKDIITRLNAESVKALGTADIKERFLDLGAVPGPMSAEAFGEFIRAEIARWSDVVKTSGVKVE
ncbi:MAG: tripartite tricarboxylate transporter substrate binding protein [Burkholderiales bacterium]|nr:tripartite tricarboxylate transporter substrate binding protein [Burkholderiales bacterium]